MPALGPDGAPMLERAHELPLAPPRLCEAGPCRHYHVMQVQLDAQQPLGSGPTGSVGSVFHTELHHYCYPEVGIETNLGGQPVLACNRWVPITSLFRRRRGIMRTYQRALERFHRAREEEVAELDEMPPAKVRVKVEFADDVQVAVVRRDEDSWPSDHGLIDMIQECAQRGHLTLGVFKVFLTPASDVYGSQPIGNVHATLAEIGVGDGDTITVHLTPPSKETP